MAAQTEQSPRDQYFRMTDSENNAMRSPGVEDLTPI